MKISIITVTWNSRALIAEQIRSIHAAAKNVQIEQIIVDNASTDGTADFLQTNFPFVRLIANEKNAGFVAANNQALPFASGEFLLFLNPDMRLEPGSLDTIVDWFVQHEKAGIVCPKLVDENGKLNLDAQPRRFPCLLDQISIIFKINHIFPGVLNRYLMRDFDCNKEQIVDSVRGSFMLMRPEIIKQLGWAFDPRYFIWFEDVDICREVKRLGFEVWYTPVISAVDYVGQSFKQRGSLWKQKQFTRSMLIYFQKWEPWYIWICIAIARPFGIVVTWIKQKIYE
jgi:GT2 family glycosyltransferase